jgi:CRP-like cAMP-binding protein
MTIESEVRSLQAIPMFRGVDATKLKLLAFTSERMSFEPGERLFAQGDVSDSAFVILAGSVVVSINAADGPMRIADIGAGAIVGEMGVLSGSRRSATVTAAEPTVALHIGKDVFFDLLKEFPAIAIAVMRDIAVRLEKTNAQLARLQR